MANTVRVVKSLLLNWSLVALAVLELPMVPNLYSFVERGGKLIRHFRIPRHTMVPQRVLGILLNSINLLALPRVPNNKLVFLTCSGENFLFTMAPTDRINGTIVV